MNADTKFGLKITLGFIAIVFLVSLFIPKQPGG